MMTLKHDKLIHKQEKVLRLMRIFNDKTFKDTKIAFNRLKLRKVPALNLNGIKKSIG